MRSTFWLKRKGNKFGAKKTIIDGIKFDSKREAEYYSQLKIMQRGGLIQSFKRQVSFDLFAHSSVSLGSFTHPTEIAHHIVDFLVINLRGNREVHEVKGMETDVWKLKRKIFEANYPEIKYIVIK